MFLEQAAAAVKAALRAWALQYVLAPLRAAECYAHFMSSKNTNFYYSIQFREIWKLIVMFTNVLFIFFEVYSFFFVCT